MDQETYYIRTTGAPVGTRVRLIRVPDITELAFMYERGYRFDVTWDPWREHVKRYSELEWVIVDRWWFVPVRGSRPLVYKPLVSVRDVGEPPFISFAVPPDCIRPI